MADRIAVVGAGLAGLACARTLLRGGRDVVLYEQERIPGGRLATARSATAAFDSAAQYFTVQDPGFAQHVEEAERAAAVARWTPRWPTDTRESATIRVGTPGMSAFGRYFAGPLDIRYSSRVVAIERSAAGWRLRDHIDSITERHSAVVLALPAPPARELVAPFAAAAARIAGVTMSPCWAALLSYAAPLAVELDADWRPHPVLPWIARDRSKPARGGADAWVLHAGTQWTLAHLGDAPASVATALAAALPARLAATPGIGEVELPEPASVEAKLWPHARVEQPLGEDAWWDPALALGLCGDWCIGARVEAAFLSGRALGGLILGEKPQF